VRRRLAIATSRDMTGDEAEALQRAFPPLLGIRVDEKAMDRARGFYVGTVGERAPAVDDFSDRDLAIDVDAVLALAPSEPAPKASAAPKGGPAKASAAPKGGPAPTWTETDMWCAIEAAKNAAPAISGRGGDDAQYAAARAVAIEIGPHEDAIELVLREYYDPRCVPPFVGSKDGKRIAYYAKKTAAEQSTLAGMWARRDHLRKRRAADGSTAESKPDTALLVVFRDGRDVWHYDPRGEDYVRFTDRTAIASMLDAGLDTLIDLKGGGKSWMSVPSLLAHATQAGLVGWAEEVHTDFRGSGRGEWDPAAKRMLLGVRPRDVEPRTDPDVDTWFRALTGEHYETACTFVAACAQAYLDRPAIALALLGPDSIGKTLLACALAYMWGATHPVPLRTVVQQFNLSLCRCPIVLDDECDALKAGLVSTESFRQLVQATSRDVEPKGQEKRTLLGAQRFLITGNDLTDIKFTDVEAGALGAMAQRMAIIQVQKERRDELVEMLGRFCPNGRADMKRLAGHLAWLQIKHADRIGEARFIGGSEATAWAARVALVRQYVERHPEVYDPIVAVILGGAETAETIVRHSGLLVRQGGPLVSQGELLVWPKALASEINPLYGPRIDVRKALSPVLGQRRTPTLNGKTITMWVVDHRVIAAAAEVAVRQDLAR
jgi:hypothetical protein